MSKKDQAERILLEKPTVFADACNYALFGGEEVIKPDSLREQDASQIAVLLNKEIAEVTSRLETEAGENDRGSGVREGLAERGEANSQTEAATAKSRRRRQSARHDPETYEERVRDVYRKAAVMSDGNTTYVLLGIEAQSAPNREMAVRVMMADAISYTAQTRRLRDANRAAGRLGKSDFLGGLLPEDRICPVITLVILFSAEGWDVPRSLSDLFEDYDPRLEPYIQDYRLNLITPSEITDFDVFKSSLGPTLEFMKHTNDKEAMKKLLTDKADIYSNLDPDAARVLGKFAKINVRELNNTGTETEVSMCKAWDDYAKEVADDAVKKVMAENEKVMAEKEKEWENEYSNLTTEIARLQKEIARLQQA